MADCRPGDALAHLRRDLTWQGLDVSKPFHACEDTPAIRNAVFRLLMTQPIRIDATALEKRKAAPHLHDELALYKMGWWLHFKHVAPLVATEQDRLLVVAASLGTKKTDSDPCIQLADYCCWAVQRAWERNDRSFLELLGNKVSSNKDIFETGTTHYY